MSWKQTTRGHLDDFVCSTHKDQVVSLYCQTCDDLICPKCITQGPSSTSHHKQHVYLDLSDAYQVKQKQLNQMMIHFKDATQTKKNERLELNALGQKLKLELLRKKTALSKQTRCLHDSITRQEKCYLHHLHKLLKPAIMRNESRFSEVDFEVVNREGALGSAESIYSIPEEKAIKFLRAVKRIESDLEKSSTDSCPVSVDSVPEYLVVQRETLSLHQYKHLITRAFVFPDEVPGVPHVLPSWCTVGTTSASITFKSLNNPAVYSYVVVCQPYHLYTKRDIKSDLKNTEFKGTGSSHSDLQIIEREKLKFRASNCLPWNKRGCDSQVFRMKARAGRVTAVIRNLVPETLYTVEIYAVNSTGSSQPAKVFLTTLTYPKASAQGCISFKEPRSQKSLQFLFQLFVTATKCMFLLFILFWILYAMYLSWNTVTEDCWMLVSNVCNFVSAIPHPYFSYVLELLNSKRVLDLMTFQMMKTNLNDDSFIEDTVTVEPHISNADLPAVKIQDNWLMQLVRQWEWIFGENNTSILW